MLESLTKLFYLAAGTMLQVRRHLSEGSWQKKNEVSAREEYPVTPAVRYLRGMKIPFVPRIYPYEEHGGTRHAAECLHVPEHAVIKTLVFESDPRHPLLVLMHGDREVSAKQLARALNVKHVAPCAIADAQRHTGYTVGGISPFGTRAPLPMYVESTIFILPRIYINGGKRGFLVEIDPADLRRSLKPTDVEVAIQPTP